MQEKMQKAIIELVDSLFHGYVKSTFYQNWEDQSKAIQDATEQKYRSGEQITRSGMYFGTLRAKRDGYKQAGVDTFGQANPLFVYKPKQAQNAELVERVSNEMNSTWEDVDGLGTWLSLWDDAVDYGVAIAYNYYDRDVVRAESMVEGKEVWGEFLEFQEEDQVSEGSTFMRVHPFNWRGDVRGHTRLRWEGIEWEWGMDDFIKMMQDPNSDKKALNKCIDKLKKRKGTKSESYYNHHDEENEQYKKTDCLYVKEYWGDVSQCLHKELQKDSNEYQILTCEGEIIKIARNRIKGFRPISRVRLSPRNDVPIGYNVLAPILPHQKLTNLSYNLAIDDLIMRQHLGLAYDPQQLRNPNDLLNPEGARQSIQMRNDADWNKLPRFITDSRSGTLTDVVSLMRDLVGRDEQMLTLSDGALGMQGGAQDGTATAARFLASAGNRVLRSNIIYSERTGLRIIAKNMMLLKLRNNPDGVLLNPSEKMEVWKNNLFHADDSVTKDQFMAGQALTQFGNVMQGILSQVAPADGGADHLMAYARDFGKTLGISTSQLDQYIPQAQPINAIPAPQPQGELAPPPEGGALQEPLTQPLEEVTSEASGF